MARYVVLSDSWNQPQDFVIKVTIAFNHSIQYPHRQFFSSILAIPLDHSKWFRFPEALNQESRF